MLKCYFVQKKVPAKEDTVILGDIAFLQQKSWARDVAGIFHCYFFPFLIPASQKLSPGYKHLDYLVEENLRKLCSINHSWGSRQSKDCPTEMLLCVLFLLHTSSIWIMMANTSHSFRLAYVCIEHTVNQKAKLLKVIM